jgi:hypothetical protein
LSPTRAFASDRSFLFPNSQRYVLHVPHLVYADDPYFILYFLGCPHTRSFIRHYA